MILLIVIGILLLIVDLMVYTRTWRQALMRVLYITIFVALLLTITLHETLTPEH